MLVEQIAEEGRKTGDIGGRAASRSYLLKKKHTTTRRQSAPYAGVLALLCIGLLTGLSGAGAPGVQARAHETARTHGSPSLDGSPPRRASAPRLLRVADPALEGNPFLAHLLPSPLFAADDALVPAPQQALPSRSTQALPAGAAFPVSGGQGNALPPAPQALSVRATARTTIDAQLLPATLSEQDDSPPLSQEPQGDPLATVAMTAPRGIWFTGPHGATTGLSAALSTLPDRAVRLSSLSLERVLASQTFSSSVAVVVSGKVDDPAGDLAFTAQRPPIAPGLRMQGVHPGVTQYLQQTRPRPEIPQATATPQPAVQATATPQPTPTSGPYSQAGLIVAVTPTPAPGNPTTWTEGSMPGGPAQMFYVTGYTPTGQKTATGTIPYYGEVAVDPSVIPLGSIVYIQGLGTFRAEDTGGLIRGRRVDVFVDSETTAAAITGWRLVSWSHS